MTRKELSQLYYLEREIAQQEEQLAKLEAEAFNAVARLTGMPRGGETSDKVGNLAVQIAEIRALIHLNLQKRWYEKNRLMRYIALVEDSMMRQILTYRFVDGMDWYQVAEAIGGNNNAANIRQMCHRYLSK